MLDTGPARPATRRRQWGISSRCRRMLTDEEKRDEARREKERAARSEKKSKAVANAPTSTGEPLTIADGMSRYPETLKTERTARSWAIYGVLDEASFVAYREQFDDASTDFPARR